MIALIATILMSPAWAYLNPKLGVYEVTGILSIVPGQDAKFVVNPMSSNRYVMRVTNTNGIVANLKQEKYFSQVKAKIKVQTLGPGQADIKILELKSVQVDKLPQYDGDFQVFP